MSVARLIAGKGSFVPVIGSDSRLQDVIDKLDVEDAGALVVTDDNRNILGIITERDIARGLKVHGPGVVDRPVRSLMTSPVITCDIGEPIERVLELMDTHQIHYVPITNDGALCGIINILDLVKYRLAEIQSEAEALKAYVAGSR
jgi:CBS domain-containing protein